MTSREDQQMHQAVRDAVMSWWTIRTLEQFDTVIYRPRADRPPKLQDHSGWQGTVLRVKPGAAMLLFNDLSTFAALNEEMRPTQ